MSVYNTDMITRCFNNILLTYIDVVISLHKIVIVSNQ